MVVPLKLTQFYGHKVPRPRVYPDVKFNDQRVDPPASVNEALLNWAADAHWSMGGLSFRRLRAQGKVEGNVRRLRAMVEDEEAKESANRKASPNQVSDAAMDRRSAAARREAAGAARERRNGDEEAQQQTSPDSLVVETPKLKKSKSVLEEKPVSARTKKGQQELSPDSVVVETPTIVRAKADRKRKGGSAIETAKAVRRSKDSSFPSTPASTGDDDGRLTRSAKKAFTDQDALRLQTRKLDSRARKALMVSDSESSESDDGLEDFLREKSRPLRRSSRLVKTENTSSDSADQDSV